VFYKWKLVESRPRFFIEFCERQTSRFGSSNDGEHVVFMMQENRAFDHYFGTRRGVRG